MEPSDDSQQAYQVTKGQAASILIVMLVLLTIDYADRSILSVVLQQIKISLGLSDTQLGLVQAVFSISIGLITIPMGWVVDRWSRRKAAGIMALAWSAATFVTGLATSLVSLLVSIACVGLGQSGFTTVGAGWLSVAFKKENRSIVAGFFGIGGAGGTALGLMVGGYLLQQTGMWQMPFYVFAVPGVIFGIWAFFLKDYQSVKAEGESGVGMQYLKDWIGLLKMKSFLLITLGQTCWGLVNFTWLGWVPAFMMRSYQMDAGQVGGIVGTAALVGAVGSIVCGFIADGWYKKSRGARIYMMAVVQFIFTILTAAIFYFMGSIPISVMTALLVAQMFAVGMITPLIFTLTMDISPLSHRFSSYSLMATCVYIAGALGPWIVGAISDSVGGGAAGIRTGFLWLLPVALAAVICYVINWKYYPQDCESVSDEVYSEK